MLKIILISVSCQLIYLSHELSSWTRSDIPVKCSVRGSSCLPVTLSSTVLVWHGTSSCTKQPLQTAINRSMTHEVSFSPTSPTVKLHQSSENTGPSINKQESRWYRERGCPSTLLTSLNISDGWLFLDAKYLVFPLSNCPPVLDKKKSVWVCYGVRIVMADLKMTKLCPLKLPIYVYIHTYIVDRLYMYICNRFYHQGTARHFEKSNYPYFCWEFNQYHCLSREWYQSSHLILVKKANSLKYQSISSKKILLGQRLKAYMSQITPPPPFHFFLKDCSLRKFTVFE